MKLLTLDVGVTTGWSLWENEELQDSGVFDHETAQGNLCALQQRDPTLIVAERAVPHGLDTASLACAAVMHDVNTTFGDKVRWITASQWKPAMQSRRRNVAAEANGRLGRTRLIVHELDAICIGRFTILFKKGKWYGVPV
jgi:hypothetical protein